MLKCESCGKEFTVFPSEKQSRYCSRKCFHDANLVNKTQNICKVCGIKFIVWPYEKDRGFCSPRCYWISLQGRRLSKEHIEKCRLANLGHVVSEETRMKISSKNKGHEVSEETREKIRLKNQQYYGPKSPNWRGGISFEPYSIQFSRMLKRAVKDRDRATCQNCGKTEKELKRELSIHHIDYDKKNNYHYQLNLFMR